MIAALSVAIPLKHERLEAAEISPSATWSEGINVLHNGALSDRKESYGLFDIRAEKWIIREEGKERYVDILPDAIIDAAGGEIAGREVTSVNLCDMHTHQLYDMRSYRWISDKEELSIRQGKQAISIPPSGDAWNYGDISPERYGAIDSALDRIRNKGVAVEIRFGVVDPAGITYYGPITDKELQQEYPHLYQHVQQRRALRRVWDERIKPLIYKLDAAKLNSLHDKYIHLGQEYNMNTTLEQDTLERKRLDIITWLLRGRVGYEGIMFELLLDQQNGLELLRDYKAIIAVRKKDVSAMSNAVDNWRNKSLAIPPEKLPSTEEYKTLREAYAQNGSKVRFVPNSQIPAEPHCPGTDYKQPSTSSNPPPAL